MSPRIDRSANPARWYAACEAAIGVWGVVLVFLLAPATGWLLEVLGPQPSPALHWSVAFCGVFVLLAPATAAMGATLPAMERALAALRGRGVSIAALYAGNTFGAVLGVLATVFVLVPELGLARTAAVCAALNFLCAAAAAKVFDAPAAVRGRRAADARGRRRSAGARRDGTARHRLRSARGPRREPGRREHGVHVRDAARGVSRRHGARRCGVQPLAAALVRRSAHSRSVAPSGGRGVLARRAGPYGGRADQGARAARARPRDGGGARERGAVATAAFLLPTVAMGALFSHLCTRAAEAGVGFGRALGVNTLGAALAPLVFGVWLLPALGSKLALVLVAAGYAALASRRAWARPTQWLAAGAVVALGVWAPALVIVDVPEGGRIVSYREGVMAAVSVVEDAYGVARLHIDNRQQEGSSATVLADARQALLPILLHPAPRRALFLGLGTGITASAAAQDPLLRVDAVELLPEVVAASAYFTHGAPLRPHLLVADARRYVRTSREDYDVIVADNFHPARSGSGSLYTVEHFAAVRERLAPGGLFCQWLPLHQLDLDTLRSITRTFLAVYPDGAAVLATNSLDTPVVGLVARRDGERFDVSEVRERLHATETMLRLGDFGIADDLALLGSFIAGPRALERFAAGAPLNTDDRPVVAYRAPRITYAADSLPRDRLIALLHAVEIGPHELLAAPVDAAWGARVAAYRSARDRFIEAGRAVRPTSDVRRMLAQVREPLLAVLRDEPGLSTRVRPAAQDGGRSRPRRRGGRASPARGPRARATRTARGGAGAARAHGRRAVTNFRQGRAALSISCSARISTGFTRWPSKPAARVRCRSSVWP